MTAFWISIAYMVVIILIGYFTSKVNKTTEKYFAAERSIPWPLVGSMLFAMIFAGPTMTGPIANGYTSGIECVWAVWGMAIGCIWYIAGGVKDLYRIAGRHGAMSVPGVFRYRFDKKTQLLMMVFMVIVFTMFFTLQISAIGILFSSLTGWSYTAMAVLAGIGFVLMAWFGYTGVAWQNLLHNIMMFIGFLVLVICSVNWAGGLPNMFRELPFTPYWNLFYPSFNVGGADMFSSIFQVFVSGTIVSCCFVAKDRSHAKKGFIFGAILAAVFGTFGPLSGMAAKVAMGEGADPNQILNILVGQFGPIVAILASIAVLAATASTAPGLLITVVSAIVNDLYPAVKPGVSEKSKMLLTRILLIGVALFALWLSFTFANDMVGYLFYAFYINSVAGVILWVSCVWGKVSANSAFASLLFGGGVCIVWEILGEPFGINPFWAAMAMCIVSLVILSALNKTVDPKFLEFRKELDYLKANPDVEFEEYMEQHKEEIALNVKEKN